MSLTSTGEDRAVRLTETLREKGALHSTEWSAAVAGVPRHLFVPRFYEQQGSSGWQLVDGDDPDQHERWLDTVYSDRGLTITLDPDGRNQTSSSSQPALMARMLEMLDIRDEHRVLEIGTGSGYNVALLCHRLGDTHVFSVDIAADLIENARHRLAQLDYHPVLVTCDGAGGLPGHAPYDRIIATCSVPAVPRPWAHQLTEGGLLLIDIKVGPYAGNLALLQRHGNELAGRFASAWATFMGMRHQHAAPQPRVPPDTSASSHRFTSIGAHPWDNLCAWFLTQLDIGTPMTFGYILQENTRQPTHTRYTTADGSWCEVALGADDDRRPIRQGGPRSLWDMVERAHQRWHEWGNPGWERLGLTIIPTEDHILWLDSPDHPVASFKPLMS